MGETPFSYGFAIGMQTALGVPNDTIRDLTDATSISGTAVTSEDGAILGDPDSGIGESGISHTPTRVFAEKSRLAGFTEQPTDFLREGVENLSVAFTLKGNGRTLTGPTDAEFAPVNGIDAILRAGGLTAAPDPALNAWLYKTALDPEYTTVKIWSSGEAYVYQDVIATSLVIANTPGEASVLTANLAGTPYAHFVEAFPTLDFSQVAGEGGQDHSPPTLENAGNYWGVGSEERGFTTSTITISNEAEEVADSNAPGGVRTRQTDRLITYEQTLYATDTEIDYEYKELIRDTAPTDQLLFSWGPFTSGTPGVGDVANSLSVAMPTPELRSMTPEKSGANLSRSLSMAAVAQATQQSFFLRFL